MAVRHLAHYGRHSLLAGALIIVVVLQALLSNIQATFSFHDTAPHTMLRSAVGKSKKNDLYLILLLFVNPIEDMKIGQHNFHPRHAVNEGPRFLVAAIRRR